jgi:hypothetical protein
MAHAARCTLADVLRMRVHAVTWSATGSILTHGKTRPHLSIPVVQRCSCGAFIHAWLQSTARCAQDFYSFATFNMDHYTGLNASKTPYGVAYGHLGATYGYDSIVLFYPVSRTVLPSCGGDTRPSRERWQSID